MAHQFEEHGIDMMVVRYSFRDYLCDVMGFSNIATCPIPLSFVTAVNVGSVWEASALAALLGRKRPRIALSAYGIPLINAISHSAGALKEQAYNPGLLTAVLLFLPVSVWPLRLNKRIDGWPPVAATVLSGILVHAVLMGSLVAYLHGTIGAPVLTAIQLINMVVPVVVVTLVCQKRSPPRQY